jgi:hypothetical protein
MQALLLQNRKPDLRAYFVWGPYLKSDTLEIARVNSDRFAIPDVSFFWTPTERLARQLAFVLKLPADRLAWDVYLMYQKGVIWEKSFPEPTYWQRQLDVIQGEPLNIPKFQSKIQALLRQK